MLLLQSDRCEPVWRWKK